MLEQIYSQQYVATSTDEPADGGARKPKRRKTASPPPDQDGYDSYEPKGVKQKGGIGYAGVLKEDVCFVHLAYYLGLTHDVRLQARTRLSRPSTHGTRRSLSAYRIYGPTSLL
jgi:hypothetical protein